jgi:hypothetical protein
MLQTSGTTNSVGQSRQRVLALFLPVAAVLYVAAEREAPYVNRELGTWYLRMNRLILTGADHRSIISSRIRSDQDF